MSIPERQFGGSDMDAKYLSELSKVANQHGPDAAEASKRFNEEVESLYVPKLSETKLQETQLSSGNDKQEHYWTNPTSKQLEKVVKDLSKPENFAKLLIYGHFDRHDPTRQGEKENQRDRVAVVKVLEALAAKGPQAVEEFAAEVNKASLAVYPEGRNMRVDYKIGWSGVLGPRLTFYCYVHNNKNYSDYTSVLLKADDSRYRQFYGSEPPAGLR